MHLPYSGGSKSSKATRHTVRRGYHGVRVPQAARYAQDHGVVVAEQNAELVEEAFWHSRSRRTRLKQQTKKMEKAMKNWRKLINAVRIARRVKEQYGDKMTKPLKEGGKKKSAKEQTVEEGKSRFFAPKPDAEEQPEEPVDVSLSRRRRTWTTTCRWTTQPTLASAPSTDSI